MFKKLIGPSFAVGFINHSYCDYDKKQYRDNIRKTFTKKEFDKLFEMINTNHVLRDKYCHEVKNQSHPSPLWWEPIKTLEELGL